MHFIRRVREGDFYLNYDYDFNYNNLTSKVYEKRRNVEKSETLAISSCSFDIISSVYFARAIPFQKLSKGDTIPLDLILDKELYNDVSIIYNGLRTIKDQQNRKIECIHFEIELIAGNHFQGK